MVSTPLQPGHSWRWAVVGGPPRQSELESIELRVIVRHSGQTTPLFLTAVRFVLVVEQPVTSTANASVNSQASLNLSGNICFVILNFIIFLFIILDVQWVQ